MSGIQALTEDLSLYVHWPFCLSKCPYCDFNSHVVNQIDQSVWREGLLTEMKTLAKNTEDRKLKSIFFWGWHPISNGAANCLRCNFRSKKNLAGR